MKVQLFIFLVFALACSLVYAAATSKPIVVKPKSVKPLAAGDADVTPTPTLPPEIQGLLRITNRFGIFLSSKF